MKYLKISFGDLKNSPSENTAIDKTSKIDYTSDLVKIFDNDPVQNGFKARASYMLSQRELTALHAYLKSLFSKFWLKWEALAAKAVIFRIIYPHVSEDDK